MREAGASRGWKEGGEGRGAEAPARDETPALAFSAALGKFSVRYSDWISLFTWECTSLGRIPPGRERRPALRPHGNPCHLRSDLLALGVEIWEGVGPGKDWGSQQSPPLVNFL